jgi:predicted transcriptional regulator
MLQSVKSISFKVPEEIRKKLEEIAAEERRPLSNLVRNIVEDYLKTRQTEK